MLPRCLAKSELSESHTSQGKGKAPEECVKAESLGAKLSVFSVRLMCAGSFPVERGRSGERGGYDCGGLLSREVWRSGTGDGCEGYEEYSGCEVAG